MKLYGSGRLQHNCIACKKVVKK